MRKIITKDEFQELKNKLPIYRDELGENLNIFNKNISELNELIEAIKICANTYGGKQHTAKLANLNFNTTILENIKDTMDSITINEKIEDYIIDETML